MPRFGEEIREGEAGTQRRGVPDTGKNPRGLQGPGCTPRAEKGGTHWHGNGIIRKYAARGVGASDGGWWVVCAVGAQVGGASHRERR